MLIVFSTDFVHKASHGRSTPCLGGSFVSLNGELGMLLVPFCISALGALADRGVRTPTSTPLPSTPQHTHQAEEDRLIRVPTQQPIHQPPTCPEQLTRQTHKALHQCLELQPQHPPLLLALSPLPAARLFREAQGPPRLEVPGQRRHHHVRP